MPRPPELSDRAVALKPSLTLEISAKAKALRDSGKDICSLSAGEPDFETPAFIVEAAQRALACGFTRYGPAAGDPDLRSALAHKLSVENGIPTQPEQVLVTNGGKQAIFNLFQVLLNPGDEVLVPAPYWLSYPEMAKLAGAKPVIIETSDATEFKVTPDQLREAITPNTKLFILNSPSNPTGSVYSADEIKELGDVCVEKGVLIMSDDIYEKLVYDGAQFTSVTGFSEEHLAHTIIVHGLAKAYSMTGWRIGFLAAPKPIAKAINALQSHSTSNATSFAQKGALAALTGPQTHLDQWLTEFNNRRSYAAERLNNMGGVSCVNSRGAFYLFPNIEDTGLKSAEFCERLLEQSKVAAVPGIAFGADSNFRISYATSMENIQNGMDRLEEFCKSL